MKKKKKKLKNRFNKKKIKKRYSQKKSRKIKRKRKKLKRKKRKIRVFKKRKKTTKKTRKVILNLLKINEKLKTVFKFNFNLDKSLQNFFQGISNKISEIRKVIREEKEKQNRIKLQAIEKERKSN